MPFPEPLIKPKKLLIITSSGGGGLLQTANAKEQEARAGDPDLAIVRIDILKDWLGNAFGAFCAEKWNRAQIQGNIDALRFVLSAQVIFDFVCWPLFFLRALRTLFRENADHIICTQPLGTSPILKAIRIYNRRRNKHIFLQMVLVDLPTKTATHFFRPIKNLSTKDRPYLKLTSIAPLLEEGQTAEDFWQANCRLSEKDICYENWYVRQAFKKFQHKKRSTDDFPLFLRFKNEDELSLMKKTFERGSLTGVVKGNEVHFLIPAKDRLITILLGSQPASDATFNYVKKFIQICKEGDFQRVPCHIFVFCADHKSDEQSLFRKVADYVEGIEQISGLITVVPFSFQTDDCIAPLFFRSDLACTRSGGQTAMELMCVSRGEIWIHSETKKDPAQKEDLSLEQLLKGIPGWEAANAIYLGKVRNARVVTPDIAPHAVELFPVNGDTGQSTRPLESMA